MLSIREQIKETRNVEQKAQQPFAVLCKFKRYLLSKSFLGSLLLFARGLRLADIYYTLLEKDLGSALHRLLLLRLTRRTCRVSLGLCR